MMCKQSRFFYILIWLHFCQFLRIPVINAFFQIPKQLYNYTLSTMQLSADVFQKWIGNSIQPEDEEALYSSTDFCFICKTTGYVSLNRNEM